ncbi:MAG: GAF domain-containing protein [Bacteriovoracaceae bacterium]|jgi:signal transduction protein with GAF and PtsI domain|nr:GAF domain-containing protein [Bacteriovoracaceae bacterium]
MSDFQEKLFYLLELSKLIHGPKSAVALYRPFVNYTQKLLFAERVSVFIFNHKTEQLDLKLGTGIENGEISLPVTKGVVGFCWRNKAPLLVNDPSGHPDFFPEIDTKTKYKTECIASALIGTTENPFGVIQALNSISGRFEKYELDLLELVGHLLSCGLSALSTSSESHHFEIDDLNVKKQKERLEQKLISLALVETGGNKQKASGVLGLSKEGLRKAIKRKAS